MKLVPRQQPAGANGTAKPKDPMMQPAGPGLPPLFVWLPKLHSRRAFYILWWILAGVVGALVVLRLMRFFRARAIRRRVAPLRKSLGTSPVALSSTVSAPKEQGGVAAAMRAAYTGYRNVAHVRVPLALFPAHTATEYFWTAAYVGLVIGLTMWGSVYKGKMNYSRVFGLAVSSLAQPS